MNHRLPAAVFLTAATLSATAALVGGLRESAQCGAVALLTLGGWAMARGRGAAGWSLPAGLALLALAAILTTRGYGQPGAVPADDGDPALWQSQISRDRPVAVALLLASTAFLIALRSLPRLPPSRRRSNAALLAAAVPVLPALAGAADQIDTPAQILPLIGGTAPAWAATIASAAVIGLAVLRADHRHLLPAGALLVAASASLLFLALTGAWLQSWNLEHPSGTRTAVVTVVIGAGPATAPPAAPSLSSTVPESGASSGAVSGSATSSGSAPDPWSAAAAVLALVRPTLLTAGAIRRPTP